MFTYEMLAWRLGRLGICMVAQTWERGQDSRCTYEYAHKYKDWMYCPINKYPA